MDSKKYPRTPHLPWSPGCSNDDRMLDSCDHFVGKNIILSEKQDGSNVCLESQYIYARSHNGPPTHPSFDWLKQFHASIKWNISPDIQLFCEFCFALHTVHYTSLPHYLAIIGVRNILTDEWWSWKDVVSYAVELSIPTVPVLFEGTLESTKELQKIVEDLAALPSLYGCDDREGVVIRLANSFPDYEFGMSVAKFVNKKFANRIGDEHWKHKQTIQNKLKK